MNQNQQLERLLDQLEGKSRATAQNPDLLETQLDEYVVIQHYMAMQKRAKNNFIDKFEDIRDDNELPALCTRTHNQG